MRVNSPKPPDELKKILELMLKKDEILILSHEDPDGDSMGSQIALGNFLQSKGKKVMMVNQDETPSRYRFLDPQKRIKRNFKGFQPDLILVLECSNLNRIGKLKELLPSQAEIVNIDHHPDNTSFGTINYLDPEASATGEIVYDLLKCANYTFDPGTAFALYTAILTDTGRFSFSNTTPRSLMICSELIQWGADPRYITDQLYFNHSQGCLRLLGSVLENLELLGNGNYCSLTIAHQSLKDFRVNPRDTQGFVDYTLFLKGVVVGSLFLETSHQVVQVSLRSQNSINVGAVAKFFGGGGHRNASGFTLNEDLKNVKKMVRQKILKALENDWRKKKKEPHLVKK
jgi:phosphoesterase RecJ-like protein